MIQKSNFLHTSTIALILAFSIICGSAVEAQTRRPISETDIFKFMWAADPQISPSGSQVVFVRVNVNEDKDKYESSLFIVPSDGSSPARQLTAGTNDRSPRWSPDGKTIAFVRTPDQVDGKSKPSSQVYLISMDGGEARAITFASNGAGSPVWAPDGKTIAFLSSPVADSAILKARRDSIRKTADSTRANHVSDVRVITRAQYRWNGGGYSDVTSHSHIWTVASSFLPGGALPGARQITSGDFDEGEPVWSPDGSRLYFTSNRQLEPYYSEAGAELFSVSSSGGVTTRVATMDGDIGGIAISPDG